MEYRESLKDKKRIVVKIGTSSLSYPNGRLNFVLIEKLAKVLSSLKKEGKDVLLVSSGAIAVGSGSLNLTEKPQELAKKQAMAAIGQTELMKIYEKSFLRFDYNVGQILLTKDVMEVESRRTNAQNAFMKILEMGIIPIINENDTISTEEIEFGDNDTLSAYVAALVKADLLIMLSDIEGLYTADPRVDRKAEKLSIIKKITPEIWDLAGSRGSSFGTGGMVTKIKAAFICEEAQIDTVIMNGNDPENIFALIEGKEIGTLFLGQKN